MTVEVEFNLKPAASEVRRFNNWLDEKIAESGLQRSLGDDLKLCLNEVLSNLISYGFRNTAEPMTRVLIRLDANRACAAVFDNGTYFDIRNWQPPENRNLKTAEPGGFGVLLIKERASHLDYRREGELNRLEIICESSGT